MNMSILHRRRAENPQFFSVLNVGSKFSESELDSIVESSSGLVTSRSLSHWPFFGRPYDEVDEDFQKWSPGSTILFTVSVLTTVGESPKVQITLTLK